MQMRKRFLLFFALFPVIVFQAGCSLNSGRGWIQEDGYRWAELSPGFWGKTGFKKIEPGESNVRFSNDVSEELIAENQLLLNGSGVAAGDIDGDGLVDLYFASLAGPNKLYKNLGGFRFEDITDEAGVAHSGFRSTGVVFADVNGNGYPDLIVTSLDKHNSLYLNNGRGKFELKKDSGLGESKGSTTAALADINGDGYPDLYITNYKKKSAKDIFGLKNLTLQNITRKTGDQYELVPPYEEHFVLFPNENEPPDFREKGEKDELYMNNGDGTFSKISDLESHFLNSDGSERGLSSDWGLTAKFQDINGDRRPDLYVSNDFWTPDKVWINRGEGVFKEMDPFSIRNFSFSSMAVDFSDINRDGYNDIFVTEMLSPVQERRLRQQISFDPFQSKVTDSEYQPLYSRNSLYLNRGDHTFAEIAWYAGLAATEWSWATRFLDVDLDGYEDLLINTGFSHDIQDLDAQRLLGQQMARTRGDFKGYVSEFPPLLLPNKALKNNGDLTFSDKSSEWGFDDEDVSHGMALADLDNDGDMDMVTNRFNNEATLYENTTTADRIAVRMKGEFSNTRGIGAKVKLTGGGVFQEKEVTAGGDYLSSSEPIIVFSAEKRNNHELIVRWPCGKKSTIDDVKTNRVYEIFESGAESVPEGKEENEFAKSNIYFEDVSDRIDHLHEATEFNDFNFQPLIPMRLSRTGPGITWFDMNNSGFDDLILTSGVEERLTVHENNRDGSFTSLQLDIVQEKTESALSFVLAWSESEFKRLVKGFSDPGKNTSNISELKLYKLSDNNIIESDSIKTGNSVIGTMSAADYDGNGYPDLFVGGSYVPGRYPENASSNLYINEAGTFRPDKKNSETFNGVGLVTGSVFFDYDNDGDQDLLISTQWGSLKLFQNENSIFSEITDEVGLNRFKGWWNGIDIGDFNSDGLPDIVATNLGLNSPYQITSGKPLKMFYSDFNNDWVVDIIEAYYDQSKKAYVPRRMLNDFASIPEIVLRNVRSHQEFASSTLQEILGMDLDSVPSKEINTLEHTLFLNTGNGFTVRSLPDQSQFMIAHTPVVADFDNDGNEDIFLSQNFFGFPKHISRQDAGRGLILRGDGKGNFRSIPGQESRVRVYGEQRTATVSDFNHDGKVDLVVSQTEGVTKLFKNQSPDTGISVTLMGPGSNKDGIGSNIRLMYDDGSKGPRRYILAGSGGRSQNSFKQILGVQSTPSELEVLWFDGTKQIIPVTEDRVHYKIEYSEK